MNEGGHDEQVEAPNPDRKSEPCTNESQASAENDESEDTRRPSYFESVLQAAEKGNVPMQFELGMLYLDCAQGHEDPRKAFEWLSKAGEAGWAEAQMQCGRMLVNGTGTWQTWCEAVKWFIKAKESSSCRSEANLYLLKLGLSWPDLVPNDVFVGSIRNAYESDSPEGWRLTAFCLWYDDRIQQNWDAALELTIRSANEGSPEAFYQLFRLREEVEFDLLESGLEPFWTRGSESGENSEEDLAFWEWEDFVDQEDDRVPRWWLLKTAARASVPGALFDYGCFLLRRAESLSENSHDALEMGRRGIECIFDAAEGGLPAAMYSLGLHFLSNGNNAGFEEALAWFGKAAELGYQQAADRLRQLYDGAGAHGRRLSEFRWLSAFAQAGIAEAQFELAELLYHGSGTVRDLPGALKWFKRAAQSGHLSAASRVALCYELGEGCPKSRDMARLWRQDQQRAILQDCAVRLGQSSDADPTVRLFPCEPLELDRWTKHLSMFPPATDRRQSGEEEEAEDETNEMALDDEGPNESELQERGDPNVADYLRSLNEEGKATPQEE